MGVADLLAARDVTMLPERVPVHRVPDLDDELLLADLFQERRDIERKRRIAARVRAGQLAVDPDFGRPVHRLEVQEDLLLLPGGRDGEGALIPKGFVRLHHPADPGKGGLDGERDEDLPFGGGLRRILRGHGVIP